MAEQKIYYKMTLAPTEDGLSIRVRRWVSIRETLCMDYCVPESELQGVQIRSRIDNKTLFEAAKNEKYCRRIHKTNSRIAFPTEQAALENLRFLKRRQLGHMERDQRFIQRFLDDTREKDIDDFPADRWGLRTLPDTDELVHEYYHFD